MHTREKGARGEERAVNYLLDQGFSIITRNYQTRQGEIDCIAKDPHGTLVFIEVKCGNAKKYGHPLFWITPAKQRTLANMARRYLAEHQTRNTPARFDVIAICNDEITHLKNAFFA